nr:radical SAM protein [Candidatus Njordarchaeota archaeon]
MGQLELKGIDLLPTFRCTSRCRHCSYRSSSELAGEMALADAERYVEEAASYSVEWIWLGGGEPFLCRKMLPSVARVAKETGVPDVYVVTNGYWARNPAKAFRELSLLKHAGITIFSLSIDAFHQEHVPLECLKNALFAGKEVGFKRIGVSGQFLGSVDLDTEFNRVTEGNLRLLEEEGYFEGVKVSREVLRLCGRATDSLTPYLPTKDEEELKDAKCDPRWLPIENLGKPRAVEVDWQGNVTTCTGICIGNAKETSLSRVLDEYDYKEHPITRILEDEGPYGLLQLAKRSGYTPARRGYVDGCHMCFDARRYLMKFYPGQLRPATCYTE